MRFLILLNAVICFISANPLPADRLKLAYNRTFAGFEKDVNNNTHWSGPFTFVQGADTQFGLIDFFKNNFTGGGVWSEDLAIFKDAITEWNALNPIPKFVTICGDLVNDMPQDPHNNRSKQLNDFKNALTSLRKEIPLVLLGGNHDFLNTPTNASIKEYTDQFGDDYYSFWVKGVMFIVLNVQLYKNNTEAPEHYKAQDQWLDQQLLDAKSSNYSHVIVFQHVPWFLHNITEQDDPMWTIPSVERQRVVNKLYQAKVRWIFAGHYHRNAYGSYEDLQMITSSAIGAQSFDGANAKSGYRLVQVEENSVNHTWINITRTNKAFASSSITVAAALTTMASVITKFVV